MSQDRYAIIHVQSPSNRLRHLINKWFRSLHLPVISPKLEAWFPHPRTICGRSVHEMFKREARSVRKKIGDKPKCRLGSSNIQAECLSECWFGEPMERRPFVGIGEDCTSKRNLVLPPVILGQVGNNTRVEILLVRKKKYLVYATRTEVKSPVGFSTTGLQTVTNPLREMYLLRP